MRKLYVIVDRIRWLLPGAPEVGKISANKQEAAVDTGSDGQGCNAAEKVAT